jgi:hypothetical protein
MRIETRSPHDYGVLFWLLNYALLYIYTYYHKLFEHNSKTWFGWRYHLKDSQFDETMNSAKTNAWFSWILALRQTEQKNITVSSGYPPGVTIIHDKPAGFSAPIDQWLICNQQCM